MNITKKKKGFIGNSVVVGLMTLVSRITGLVRDVALAGYLGSNKMADLFLIATRIPNTFRAIFADGAFNNTFIPLFSSVEKSGNEKQLRVFARNILSILFYVLMFFSIIALIFMPALVMMFAGGIKSDIGSFNNLVFLCRIAFPFLIFVSITRFFAGILETRNKFAFAAFSPAIVNIIGIIGTLIAGIYSYNVALWAAWAFMIGGIIQSLVLYFATLKSGFGIVPFPIWTFCKNFTQIIREKNIKKFIKNIGPGIVSGGIYNFNIMVSTFFAASITGAISWIYYAERIVQLPLGIIGIAIGTVLLPKMSTAKNDDDAQAYLNRAFKASMLLMIPTAFGLMIIGSFVISLIYQRGAFGAADTVAVNNALVILAIGLPFLSLNRYLGIVFYSRGDTKTPMQIACACAVLNVMFSFFLVRKFGYTGVAIASVAITIFNFLMLYGAMLWKKFGQIYLETFLFFCKSIFSSVIMVAGLIWGLRLLDIFNIWDSGFYLLHKLFLVFAFCGIGAITYFIAFVILSLIGKIYRKFYVKYSAK